jgi:hypothetical protein
MVCYNTYRPDSDSTTKHFSDSIMEIFQRSITPLGLNIVKELGQNILIEEYCSRQEGLGFKHIKRRYLAEIFDLEHDNRSYLIPLIRIKESSGIRNTYDWTYTPMVSAQIIIWIIKNNEVIYEKNVAAGPILSEQAVLKVWPEPDKYPTKQFEPAHWDTLVGLVMKEYIERLK